MNLPDGTGLDVVRDIRADPTRRQLPIVILSGIVDRATVNHAYVLGANSYVSKGVRGRSIGEIMRNLYGHWFRDALLPTPVLPTRTYEYVARAVGIRSRKSALFMRVGEKLGLDEGGICMNLALREGNLANLLAFLAGQLGARELADSLLDAAEVVQRNEAHILTELEPREVRTPEDLGLFVQRVISNIHVDVIARVFGQLFPIVPVAMTAMREVAASTLEDIASWIELRSGDGRLRDRVAKLRADAAHIRRPL